MEKKQNLCFSACPSPPCWLQTQLLTCQTRLRWGMHKESLSSAKQEYRALTTGDKCCLGAPLSYVARGARDYLVRSSSVSLFAAEGVFWQNDKRPAWIFKKEKKICNASGLPLLERCVPGTTQDPLVCSRIAGKQTDRARGKKRKKELWKPLISLKGFKCRQAGGHSSFLSSLFSTFFFPPTLSPPLAAVITRAHQRDLLLSPYAV